jgi:hypothetical protein
MGDIISEGEMRERIRQALLDHDEDILRTEMFSSIDDGTEKPYNYYMLLRETLDELYEELPDDEYLAALEAAPFWHDGQFVQFGLEDDRELFGIVKRVINDWDPEGLLSGGAPDDEYDMETGKICSRLESDKDIDEIAWGVYHVLAKCFNYGEPVRHSVFPEYTIIAGRLMAAIRESGLENFGHFVEKPYTIAELAELEQRLAEFIKVIGRELADIETSEGANEYLNTLYASLKSEYDYLSGDDLDSLYDYCVSEAMNHMWRNGDDAFKKSRYSEIDRILSGLWKYKTHRPRLRREFPVGLWKLYGIWDKLSDTNKLKFGEIVNFELEDLRNGLV